MNMPIASSGGPIVEEELRQISGFLAGLATAGELHARAAELQGRALP